MNHFFLFSTILFHLVICHMGFPVPEQPWFPQAPVLPVPEGRQVQVATVEELIRAVEQAQPGDVILLQDGTYYLPRYIEIQEDRVTLRSASGNRNTVVLDGSQSIHGELLGFRSCSGVTVAHITIQNIRWNGFKINSDFNVQNLTIYDCVIHNIWRTGVKSFVSHWRTVSKSVQKLQRQYCLFYNDRPKRFSDDPSDTLRISMGITSEDRYHVRQRMDHQRQRIYRYQRSNRTGAGMHFHVASC